MIQSPSRGKSVILIVDDTPTHLKFLIQSLRETYDILVAPSGQKALELAAVNNPDLILLDIIMPGMDGYETCRRLKSAPETRDIPIIFVTVKDEAEDEFNGLELGAIDYIKKPFSIPIVKMRIRNHLELKLYRDLLQTLSSRDGLTGMANRRHYEEYLTQEWGRAARAGTEISLILMDIDCFKPYNDAYGHVAGDECLVKVANAINESVERSTDLVARYGGEEFACILVGTDSSGSLQIAERIRQNVEELNITHAHSVVANHVTLSLGLCTTKVNGQDSPNEFVEAADRNLYLAKENGRNRVIANPLAEED